MRATDPFDACDRLTGLFERAIPLEAKARESSDDSVRVPILAFALAQLRMRVRPAFQPGWIRTDPVHVTLFGGTNTGKSTVLNLLLGRAAAGMGVRARYSQHPEAYHTDASGNGWLDGTGPRFLGYRRHRDEHPPRQSDDELRRDGYHPALAVFDVEALACPRLAPVVTTSAVLWDGPDFSTEEAGIYLSSVIDLLALGDLVVMAVTDEAYADARGTLLLRMMSDSGVTLLVVANKLPPNPTLLDDIARTLESASRCRARVLRLPEARGASPSERLEFLLGTVEALALRETVAREARRGPELKRIALKGAIAFLEEHFDEVLRPLADEASVADEWGRKVERLTETLILEPYHRDYLESVRYGEFNRTLVHLMELLQVPWIGPFLEVVGRVVRIPLRFATRGIRKLLGLQVDATRPPEEEVLLEAIQTWLLALKAEVQVLARAGNPQVWEDVLRQLESERFRAELLARFNQALVGYREQLEIEVRDRGEALFNKLKEKPARLAMLRGTNLVVSGASVALAIKTAGLDWSDAVIGPLVAGLWQNLLEWGLGRYLETLRAGLKEVQFRLLRTVVASNLEQPVRDLFRGAVSTGDLVAAREDFALIKAEAKRIVEGGAA